MEDESRSAYGNLSVTQVKTMLDQHEPMLLVDVREPHEYAFAHIEGAQLMPLSQARAWVETLPRDKPVVVMCHAGIRSQQISSYLAETLGYTNIYNMLGGIDDWSCRVDSSVSRY